MARRKTTEKCPICKVDVKSDRLQSHLSKVHPGETVRTPGQPRARARSGPGAFFAVIAVVLTIVGASVAWYVLNPPSTPAGDDDTTPPNPNPSGGNHPTKYTRIETSKGVIVAELYGNETPVTVNNFIQLANTHFFDGTIWHRVIKSFMIQGGGFLPDLKPKDTTLTPIKLETHASLKNLRGYLAMARTSDPNSATSQFFINHVDNAFLDHTASNDGYAVFGKVLTGMEVVDAIANVGTSTQQGMENVPDITVYITRIVIMNTPQG